MRRAKPQAGWGRVLAAAALGAVFILAGCQSSQDMPAYRDLSLTLFSRTESGRLTYMELARGGRLSFGGGREAGQRVTKPSLTLDDTQGQAVYDLVRQHGLLDAKGSRFAKPQQVVYELDLRVDGRRRSLRAVDEQVPGLAELHDLLYDMHVQDRYRGAAPGGTGTTNRPTPDASAADPDW